MMDNKELIEWYNKIVCALKDAEYNDALDKLFSDYQLQTVIEELIELRQYCAKINDFLDHLPVHHKFDTMIEPKLPDFEPLFDK